MTHDMPLLLVEAVPVPVEAAVVTAIRKSRCCREQHCR
jgi:hypothetical protein